MLSWFIDIGIEKLGKVVSQQEEKLRSINNRLIEAEKWINDQKKEYCDEVKKFSQTLSPTAALIPLSKNRKKIKSKKV